MVLSSLRFGITIRGSGPTVFFATGLNNCMPSAGYSKLIGLLSHNLTVVTWDGQLFLDRTSLERLIRTVSPDRRVSYIGHSSLLPSLLNAEGIDKFVLLDPAAIPREFDRSARRFLPRTVSVAPREAFVLKAEYTSRTARPFIPAGFELDVKKGTTLEIPDVGHADILDDVYASACHRIGIRGSAPLRRAIKVRARYRDNLADKITSFVLSNHFRSSASKGGFKEVNGVSPPGIQKRVLR